MREQLLGKTAKEKANLKGLEIARVAQKRRHNRTDYDIEIVDIEPIEGGVQVFARAWKSGKQLGFGTDGTVDIERFRIFNPPILVPDENGDVVHEGYDDIRKQSTYTSYREDAQEALLQVIAHNVLVMQNVHSDEKIVHGKRGNTTSTFYPDASSGATTVDGRVGRQGATQTWASIHDGAGTYVTTGTPANQYIPFIDATATTDQWENLTRAFYLFDTSAVSSDTISSATFSVYPAVTPVDTFVTNTNTVALTSSSPAADNTLTTADYNQVGTTDFATRKAVTAFTTGAYKDYSLNASGLSNIDGAGISKFALRIGRDIDNSPSWESNKEAAPNLYWADQTGTTNDPKLVVEHAAGGTTYNALAMCNF